MKKKKNIISEMYRIAFKVSWLSFGILLIITFAEYGKYLNPHYWG